MILREFWGVATSVKYKSIKDYFSPDGEALYASLEIDAFEDWDHESIEPNKYYADLDIIEGKTEAPNKRRRKNKFMVRVRLSKEDYKNKVINEGDVIKFKKAMMHTSSFRIKSFDEDKIKEAAAKNIKTDPISKKPYVTFKATTIFLSCGLNGWALESQLKRRYYWELNGVKFESEKKDKLLSQRKFAFYIEKDEFEKLKPLNKQQATMTAFNKTGKLAEMLVEVKVGYRADIDKYACSIVAIQEPTIFKSVRVVKDDAVADKVESAEIEQPQAQEQVSEIATQEMKPADTVIVQEQESDTAPIVEQVEETAPVVVDIVNIEPTEENADTETTTENNINENIENEQNGDEPDLENLMW